FFSSRRRHTRFSRDCSSHVCSSDLSVDCKVALNLNSGFEEGTGDNFDDWTKVNGGTLMFATTQPGETFGGSRALKVVRDGTLARSEERRVGRMGRGGGSARERVCGE